MTKYLLALLLALTPLVALAADGDIVSGRTHEQIVTLCEGKTGDGTCPATPYHIPKPYRFGTIYVEEDNCTAYSIAIQEHGAVAGDAHVVATLAYAGTTAFHFSQPLLPYIDAVITGEAACNTLNVYMVLYTFEW